MQHPSGRDPVRLLGWSVLVVLLVVQVWGLYAPSVPGPDGPPGIDKVSHLLGFGLPAALAWWLGARGLVGLMVLHALVSEPLQHALAPDRMLDVLDTVANLAGIGLGVAVDSAWRARNPHDGRMPSTTRRGR